jgi:hypothetical protein
MTRDPNSFVPIRLSLDVVHKRSGIFVEGDRVNALTLDRSDCVDELIDNCEINDVLDGSCCTTRDHMNCPVEKTYSAST